MPDPFHALEEIVTRDVTRALAEDMGGGDLTAKLVPADRVSQARLMTRQDGVLCGTEWFNRTFEELDPDIEIFWHHDDGDDIVSGSSLCEMEGNARAMLTAERTALNFLGHLSGIATRTRAFVDEAASGGTARIWDTRKTTPGLRTLEKAAVRAGGGANHRGNLSDWVLLKDNHIALFGITDAVARARAMWPARTVHVECDRLDQVAEALAAGADALLLDNMTLDEVRACVAAAAAAARRPLLEVSGGVTLATVASYAGTGVDCISVGGLTNAAPVLDIGLDIEPG